MEASTAPTAKLFMHGRRRVVRLPKEFRFGRTEVYVRRHGEDGVDRKSVV